MCISLIYKYHDYISCGFIQTNRKISIAEESIRIAQQLMSPSSGTYPRSGAKKEGAADGGKIAAKDAKAKGVREGNIYIISF